MNVQPWHKTILSLLVSATGVLALAVPVHALPTLRLSDGINPDITVTDQSVLDASGTPGVVVFYGSIGSWYLNITTGVSKPALGSTTNPSMVLNSVDASSSAGGILSIYFSDDFFGPTDAYMHASLHVNNTSGSVAYSTYADAGNQLFNTSTMLTSAGPFGPGPFHSEAIGSLDLSYAYSLTMQVVINHAAFGVTGLTSGLQPGGPPVPDGGSAVGLLGFALMAMAGLRRKLSATPSG